ncbi:MAG: hypothetical protein DHS20C06_17150 [Hyphobacterium sp.]|nr:MAG: hypothetical protein DHS20C06_17150 [Hyphobacterium sp.]
MGWVRFLLAAAALPAIFAGLWWILFWQGQDPDASTDTVQLSDPIGACEALQAASVAFTRTADRELEHAPALAYALASDASVTAELAAVVCAPEDWVDPKFHTRPPEIQSAAYLRLSAAQISEFETACTAMSEGFMSDSFFQTLLNETGQIEYASMLNESAAAFVCADRARHRIGAQPARRSGAEPLVQYNLDDFDLS